MGEGSMPFKTLRLEKNFLDLIVSFCQYFFSHSKKIYDVRTQYVIACEQPYSLAASRPDFIRTTAIYFNYIHMTCIS
jgi:hypothetical protein